MVPDHRTGPDGGRQQLDEQEAPAESAVLELATACLIALLLALAIYIPATSTYTSVDGPPESVVEVQPIQTAIDGMMPDGSLYRITPGNVASNWWSNHPIGDYFRDPSTRYYYCRDASGAVTRQSGSPTPC